MNHYLEFMCEICGKPQSQCKCCRVRLTDEGIQAIIKSAPEPYDEYLALPIDLLLKAQLKKVVGYLEENDLLKHSFLHYDSLQTGYIEGCDACALLEEVK